MTEKGTSKSPKSTRSQWGGMLLLPPEIAKTLPRHPDCEAIPGEESSPSLEGALFHVKLFLPTTGWTWYLTTARKDVRHISRYDNDYFCFAYCTQDGSNWEWSEVSIRDLESWAFGSLHVERDLYFRPTRFREVFPQRVSERGRVSGRGRGRQKRRAA